MSKRQKGFQLPEEVIQWLDYLESTTGASLSRIALAAFCSLLSHDDGTDDPMVAAMAVEKGQWSFFDVPWRIVQLEAERLKRLLEAEVSEAEKDDFEESIEQLATLAKCKRVGVSDLLWHMKRWMDSREAAHTSMVDGSPPTDSSAPTNAGRLGKRPVGRKRRKAESP